MGAVVLLALSSAVTYGLSDFVGGVLARRASVWAVAAMSQGTAAVLTLGLVMRDTGSPEAVHALGGIVAGLGSGVGNVAIYRGLAAGRMTVVAPLSAIAAALLPVLVGIAIGERPGVRPLIGVLVALPAVWLVSGGGFRLAGARRTDVAHGMAAGLGFGIQFSALGLIPAEAGLVPLAVSQFVSVIAIVGAAIAVSAPWVPRDRYGGLGAVAGSFAAVATACYQFAVQSGLLTIAAVLTSLYPAITVLLAAMVLRERIDRAQGAGLTLALTAVALISAG